MYKVGGSTTNTSKPPQSGYIHHFLFRQKLSAMNHDETFAGSDRSSGALDNNNSYSRRHDSSRGKDAASGCQPPEDAGKALFLDM